MPLVRKRDYTAGRRAAVLVLLFVAAVLFALAVVSFTGSGNATGGNDGLVYLPVSLLALFMAGKAWVPPSFRRGPDDPPEDDENRDRGY